MDIPINDTLLTVNHKVLIYSLAKKLATISANGEIWIDPEITLDECRFALKYILEDYARKPTSRAPDKCPSCSLGLCPDGNGGFIPCTICGNTVQPEIAPRQ